MIIAVDFDGTCVTHEYPEVGKDIGAQEVLRELVRAGHQLILWTMRSGEPLGAAVNWFTDNNISLFGINENPTQIGWTTSPKAYAQIYIDDAAMGAPIRHDLSVAERPFIDWDAARKFLPL